MRVSSWDPLSSRSREQAGLFVATESDREEEIRFDLTISGNNISIRIEVKYRIA